MKKKAAFLLVFLLFLLHGGIPAKAEVLEIKAEGEYLMGEGETMEVAGEKARKNAVRAAAEQAGVFVRSYSQVRNLVLQEDVIEVVASHAMKVTVLDEQTELVGKKSVRFRVKVRATVSSKEVEENLRKAQSDRSLVEAHRRLKEDYARLSRETEELKKKLNQSTGEERTRVLAKLGAEEAHFKANLLYEKAVRLLNESVGNLPIREAEDALTQAIFLNPRLAGAYALRGEVRAGWGDKKQIEDALADMDTAVSLEPGTAGFYTRRATILRRGWAENGCSAGVRTTCDRALADMDRALKLDPGNAWHRLAKGELLAELGDLDGAIREIDQALQSGGKVIAADPGLVAAYITRSELLKEKGDLSGALAALDKAVLLASSPSFFTDEDRRTLEFIRSVMLPGDSPDRVRARIAEKLGLSPEKGEGEAKRIMGEARKSAEKVVILAEVHKERAMLRLEAENYQGAREDMRKVCAWSRFLPEITDHFPVCRARDLEAVLNRNFSPAGRWLARGSQAESELIFGKEAQRGKPVTRRKALEAYGKAISLDPRLSEAYLRRCRLLFEWRTGNEERELALRDCSEAVRHNPELWDAWMTRASIYRQMGEPSKALEDYGQALRADPRAQGARVQRIELLREMGRMEEALEEAESYTRSDPASPEAHRMKAEFCEEAGRLQDALRAWEEYLRIRLDIDGQTRTREAGESEMAREARERIRALKEKIR